jgi:hypothetical protein
MGSFQIGGDMARSLDDITEEVWEFIPAMAELDVEPPDENDPHDMKRALLQLRQRLSVGLGDVKGPPGSPAYEHRTDLGLVPQHVKEMAALRDLADMATDEDLEALYRGDMKRLSPEFAEELEQFYGVFGKGDEWRERQWRDSQFLVLQIAEMQGAPTKWDRDHVDSVTSRLAMLNPLKDERDQAALRDYLKEVGEDDPSALAATLREQRKAARELGLDPSRVGAIFPHAGQVQPDSWAPSERIPAALSEYDLISRLGAPDDPSDAIIKSMQGGASPLADDDAIDYFTSAMGLSLNEAKRILVTMKQSAQGRRSKTGQRVAMQPSSAMCKLYRSRKLPYNPPRSLFDKAGSHSVVVLMGPPDENPRVMTWRRGSHIDCDMTEKRPKDALRALSRSLQSALFWVAEKPGRMKSNRIFVGTVGTPGLYLVWKPGQPVSLDQVAQNLKEGRKAGPALTYQTANQAKADLQQYNAALTSIGRVAYAPKVREERPERPARPRRQQAARPVVPQAIVSDKPIESMSLDELKAMATARGLQGRSKLGRGKGARQRLAAALGGTPAPKVTAPVPAVRMQEPEPESVFEEPALGAIRASTGAEPVTGSLLAPLDASLSFGNFIAELVDD